MINDSKTYTYNNHVIIIMTWAITAVYTSAESLKHAETGHIINQILLDRKLFIELLERNDFYGTTVPTCVSCSGGDFKFILLFNFTMLLFCYNIK